MNIDWDFIASLEGTKLTGYVPDPKTSRSGVTIATGVDLGQMTAGEIIGAFPADLAGRLVVYAGLHGSVALEALNRHPLTVTPAEAGLLNQYAHRAALAALKAHYADIEAQPAAVQTVLASLTFQYGSPWVRTPHIWQAAVAKDWKLLGQDFSHFGDAYQPRHDKEAAYLREHLPA